MRGLGRRGLCARQAIPSGGVALAVPAAHCLWEPRELPPELAEEIGEVPAGFTWDVRLAVKLPRPWPAMCHVPDETYGAAPLPPQL